MFAVSIARRKVTTIGPKAFSVIWNRSERARRGPPSAYSRAEITAAAVALADAEGIEALSMRRVATALGTGAASLYRHVSRKDELLDLMVDAVQSEGGELPPLTGDWRADLRTMAHRWRATIHRHPWMTSLAAARPAIGPNSLAMFEHTLAAIQPLRLPIDEMLVIVATLVAFVRGYAISELAEQEAIRRSGVTEQEWLDAHRPYLERLITAGRHPLVSRLILDAELPHAPDRSERGFTLGLERVLDGLAANIPELGQ